MCFAENGFQGIDTPLVLLRRSDRDAHPFRELVPAHGADNDTQLLQFGKDFLALTNAHQDKICRGPNILEA
jgi:hypothetical protein